MLNQTVTLNQNDRLLLQSASASNLTPLPVTHLSQPQDSPPIAAESSASDNISVVHIVDEAKLSATDADTNKLLNSDELVTSTDMDADATASSSATPPTATATAVAASAGSEDVSMGMEIVDP
jgi:hypothetical protein